MSLPTKSEFFATKLTSSRTMALTNVVQLTGHENYDLWANTMIVVWNTNKVFELVVEGRVPEEDNPSEVLAYNDLCTLAKGIYIQVVSKDILADILELQNPHLMWTHLESEFKKNSSFNLIHQLRSLVLLASEYDPSQPMSKNIGKIETEYSRLFKLARDSSDNERKCFSQFLKSDMIKRDFLLCFLAQDQKNVVDNLSTKDNLSYAEVKQRLYDLDHGGPTQLALVTREAEPKTHISKPRKPNRVAKRVQCTYCRKHHPSNSNGHDWRNCPRIRDRGPNNRTRARVVPILEQANTTVQNTTENDSLVSYPAPVL